MLAWSGRQWSGATSVVEDEELLEDESLWRDDDADDHTGWWCVRTDPFPCPADGCSFVAEFMTAAHLVLVWQERDDPNLLWHAQRAKEVGRNPRVVSYEPLVRPERVVLRVGGGRPPVHGVKGKRPVSPDRATARNRLFDLTGDAAAATVAP